MRNPFRIIRPGAQRDPGDDFWYAPIGKPVAAGVAVTVDRALQLPVVFDCLTVLSQSVASLPFAIFERRPDGSKTRQDRHPLMQVLSDPNPETTSAEFFGQMEWDLASEGNFYAEIRAGDLGPISELWRLEPALVTLQRLPDGSKRYEVRDGAVTRRLLDDEVWHVKAFPHVNGGLQGASPIMVGREPIGAAIALQDYTARFFANDATPPFVIEHPSHFADDASRMNFLQAIKRWWGGARRHSPGVLEFGMKLNRVGVNNEEAQFLETRKELSYEVARLWRMPPHKVGLLERATNNNIEHQSLEFVTDTLMPWLTLIEKSIRKHLIIADRRFFFEFNVAGLMRGDFKTRMEGYAQARQWGWLSVNDIRKLENMNPIEGGDTYLQPLNMVPVGSSAAAAPPRADAELLGADGRAVSRRFGTQWVRREAPGANVFFLEDHRHVA